MCELELPKAALYRAQQADVYSYAIAAVSPRNILLAELQSPGVNVFFP